MRPNRRSWCLLLLLAAVAGCGLEPASICGDDDQDGSNRCQGDCRDDLAAVRPGAPELCDGWDNDCDGLIDEACDASSQETSCKPGDLPRSCGEPGRSCLQHCATDGFWSACLPTGAEPSAPADDSLERCGPCAVACADAVNAQAICRTGSCGRGPCAPGTFDLDGNATYGCEARCEGRQCTVGSARVRVDNVPIPEASSAWHAFSSASSLGAGAQSHAPRYIHLGTLGEHGGLVNETSFQSADRHLHLGGFIALTR